ncbi:hypothetical protein KSS87_005919 [Heliosperma pusillum]|nr:hypothetical protein KSS87_005919 [Heliosperma pusillum]
MLDTFNRGCDNSDFCPFEVFKEKILEPHLKIDYHDICTVKDLHKKSPVQKPAPILSAPEFHWLA